MKDVEHKDTIAVDLDGTLAHWDPKDEYDPTKIGKPIKPMVERVKRWIAQGHKVIIFTARAGESGSFPHIHAWLRAQGIPDLQVTNKKGKEIGEIWDDRAIAVERNTGKVLGGHTRHDQSWEDGAREAMK
jgi:hypothetical protein